MTQGSILRTYIRTIIQESAVEASSALSQDMALVPVHRRGGTLLLLLSIPEFTKVYKGIKSSYSQTLKSVYGMIFFGQNRSKGEAWHAKEVYSAAAEKNFGPLMYDAAMAYASPNPLMSDRHSVSKASRNVWKKYKETRSDVTKLPLDNVEDPKTPPTIDDSETGIDEPTGPLNFAYSVERMDPNIRKLINQGEELLHAGGIYMEEFLTTLASLYFDKKFSA